jgi:competence protein ComEC
MSKNTAQEVIKPSVPKLLRAVFLYTGQGDSTIVAIPTGENTDDYQYVLIDADLDKEKKEVNLVSLLKDLLDGNKLSMYINTHPHKDHTGGIKEIYDEVGIKEVLHSNHTSTGEDKNSYDELHYVLKKVSKSNEYHLKGTNDLNKVRNTDDEEIIKKIGLIDYQVFAPAEYVCDEIEDEDEETRRNRIHEQCAVFKFTYGGKSIMFTGDANKAAWKKHITKYHKDNLKADVTTASHHGSRTAFKDDEDDDSPYKKHLEYIGAEHLIISAPKQKDSPHGHPNDDALEIYKEFFDEDNIYHLGEKPYCIVVDIDADGNLSVSEDLKLIEAYCKDNCEEKKDEKVEESNNRSSVLKSYAANARPWKQ